MTGYSGHKYVEGEEVLFKEEEKFVGLVQDKLQEWKEIESGSSKQVMIELFQPVE